jgi:AraC-like DNA-binding protein
VEFSHPRPGPLAEYERVFRCPVLFGQHQNRLLLRPEDLALPVLRHDQSLYALFNRLLTEKGQEQKARENFTERVRKVLMKDFKGLVPPLEVAAAHLNLSARSFQRKLQLEGSSYRSVAARLKKELALQLLQHANVKVNGIAEVLGYTEPSSFRKAFKGWTQATPVQVKKKAG